MVTNGILYLPKETPHLKKFEVPKGFPTDLSCDLLLGPKFKVLSKCFLTGIKTIFSLSKTSNKSELYPL